MTYSGDFREAALAYKQSGHTFAQLSKTFKITPQTYYNWLNLKNTTGTLNAHKTQTRNRKINPQKLRQLIEENPDAYLKEIAKHFNCSAPAIHKKLSKLKITRKKNQSHTPKNQKQNAKPS
jgi:transposase